MTQPQKKRLGRGLAALIGDDTSEDSVVQDIRSLRHVPIEMLHASPNNPRKHFAEPELQDLAKSIADKGLLQPLVVRSRAGGEYEIVAGERRWRAAQRAGVHDVPVLIRELTDGEALEIALIENIQRADLNPLEEARAYSMLLQEFAYTQLQLAEAIGKSRSHIANTLRGRLLLLKAPPNWRNRSSSSGFRCARQKPWRAMPGRLARSPPSLGLKKIRIRNHLRRSCGKQRA